MLEKVPLLNFPNSRLILDSRPEGIKGWLGKIPKNRAVRISRGRLHAGQRY